MDPGTQDMPPHILDTVHNLFYFLISRFNEIFLFHFQAGMSAYFYQKGVMEDSVFHFVQNFISEASLRVYPNREALEEAFRQACVVSPSYQYSYY